MSTRENDFEFIRNLLARFSQTFDLGDAAGVSKLFVENGVLDTTAPAPRLAGRYVGRASIQNYVDLSIEYTAGRTRTSPVQIVTTLDGNEAHVRSYAIVTKDYGPPELPGDLTHSELLTTGIFFDSLVREKGTWKFTERKFRHDAHPDVLALVHGEGETL